MRKKIVFKRDAVIFLVFIMFAAWSFIAGQVEEEILNVRENINQAANIETGIGRSVIGDLAAVAEVIDGDTIKLETGETVRYLGIDTPELTHMPPDCYAQEAALMNKELVDGKTIRLIKDVRNTDRYGRWLRYVYIDDLLINLELVRLGYARSFSVPPDTANQDLFIESERLAREAKAGLWGGCDEKILNIWEQNTPERAETAEYQADTDMPVIEDAPECFCDYNFYDCRDFSNHNAAQGLYDCCLKKTNQDIHMIDSDGDGIACEQLIDM